MPWVDFLRQAPDWSISFPVEFADIDCVICVFFPLFVVGTVYTKLEAFLTAVAAQQKAQEGAKNA